MFPALFPSAVPAASQLITDVQTASDTLVRDLFCTDTTPLTPVSFDGHSDFDAPDFGLASEDIGDAIERPPVQAEVTVSIHALRLPVLIFPDAARLRSL